MVVFKNKVNSIFIINAYEGEGLVESLLRREDSKTWIRIR